MGKSDLSNSALTNGKETSSDIGKEMAVKNLNEALKYIQNIAEEKKESYGKRIIAINKSNKKRILEVCRRQNNEIHDLHENFVTNLRDELDEWMTELDKMKILKNTLHGMISELKQVHDQLKTNHPARLQKIDQIHIDHVKTYRRLKRKHNEEIQEVNKKIQEDMENMSYEEIIEKSEE